MPEWGHRRWVSVLPVSATPDMSMQSASSCTRVSLWAVKGKNNADRKVCRTETEYTQKASVCEGRWWPACVIISPGSRGHALPPLLTHTCTPAGIPTIPRVPQWNSTQPEEDRSITDGGRQWTTNKWHKEGQEKTATQRAAQREGVAAGSKKRFENNSTRGPRLFSPLQPLWQFVRYSTLPKMAAPLGYSCWKLLWEPCRHRLTLHFLCTRLNLNDTRRKRRVSGYQLQVASEQEGRFHWQIPETTTALIWHAQINWEITEILQVRLSLARFILVNLSRVFADTESKSELQSNSLCQHTWPIKMILILKPHNANASVCKHCTCYTAHLIYC